MEYLIAMDLEGIHGVVGIPYSGLSKGSDTHIQACENALKEVNTAIRALFDQGADKVVFWDNHGGGGNLDPAQIDSRAIQVCPKGEPYRFDFVNGYHFDGILLMGYHSREGTLGGVLAHTYNSSKIQYVKLDGKPMGEIEIDSYICAAHKIPVLFLSSDDVCIRQAKETLPNITTVTTKFAKSRNAAEFKDEKVVLDELYEGIKTAITSYTTDMPLYPCPAKVEIRYTRMEDAEKVYNKIKEKQEIPVAYGEDAHILVFTVDRINQIPALL